ncbi:MAG TPA: TonB-dependent receptor [Vicinamibacterales bacterium]|nr:TonB-dependent receptor [Vicinamibacterales bacterium]
MSVLIGLLLFAQAASGGTLRVTVVDQTNAIVVGATVRVIGAEDATRAATIAPVQTAESGVAVVPSLAPGRYTIEAEFAGFEKRVLNDVRIRNGENRQVAVLAIEKLEAAVTVEQDKQQAASDRNGPSFGTVLTRDQIEALSDDPATLQQQLQDMAGPGAVIRIDGFEGGALPAKAMIRSIRIARDQFAAEFHSAGGVSIEIITQPGVGPLRYFSNVQMRDGDLSGRSPFVPVKGPEGNVNYGFGFGGTLKENKSSFFVNAFGTSAYDTPNLNAAVPGGTIAHALNLKAPRDNVFVNGQLDYAVTLDQTLRFSYNLTRVSNDNQGVGGYDEPERGFGTENRVHTFRVQHFGPLGRRAYTRTRVQLFVNDNSAHSDTEAPTIRVLDAFTSGGAQRAGGDHSKTIDVASDLDYVAGRHSVRVGGVLNGSWVRSDATANYLGTYTYENLDAYLANQPMNFSRRLGDPSIAYGTFQTGLYVQDDIRVRKNLTITPGVRYEAQAHVHDWTNFGPRFGVTWAPTATGQTTLRASAGIFYDWLPNATYDQVVRVDGLHQQEINVLNPAYPFVGGAGTVLPANRYVLGDGFSVPRIERLSAGVDQRFRKVNTVSVTYSYLRGARLARGLDANAPVDGVRPDPRFANVIDVVSDAASRQHELRFDASINPGAMLPLPKTAPRVSWKRTTVFANYTLNSARNNTDGPFSVPPTGDLSTEWGPALGGGGGGLPNFIPGVAVFGASASAVDVRHRLNVSLNNQIVRNVVFALSVNASSAPPYSMLSGSDDNGDGIFNDRPAGVGRNTLRASGQSTVFLMAGYNFSFGQAKGGAPPGIGVFGTGAAAQVRTVDLTPARYRMQIYVQAQNLTNERNYLGYSGTLTSPFFGRPTAVAGMRKIDVGINFGF